MTRVTEKPLERQSDESSKKADSDSHPENWTDSDPQPPASSPPKITDDKKVTRACPVGSWLFYTCPDSLTPVATQTQNDFWPANNSPPLLSLQQLSSLLLVFSSPFPPGLPIIVCLPKGLPAVFHYRFLNQTGIQNYLCCHLSLYVLVLSTQ